MVRIWSLCLSVVIAAALPGPFASAEPGNVPDFGRMSEAACRALYFESGEIDARISRGEPSAMRCLLQLRGAKAPAGIGLEHSADLFLMRYLLWRREGTKPDGLDRIAAGMDANLMAHYLRYEHRASRFLDAIAIDPRTSCPRFDAAAQSLLDKARSPEGPTPCLGYPAEEDPAALRRGEPGNGAALAALKRCEDRFEGRDQVTEMGRGNRTALLCELDAAIADGENAAPDFETHYRLYRIEKEPSGTLLTIAGQWDYDRLAFEIELAHEQTPFLGPISRDPDTYCPRFDAPAMALLRHAATPAPFGLCRLLGLQ